MRRTAVLLSVLVLVLGLGTTGVASAAVSEQPLNCNGETLVSAGYVTAGDQRLGAIQLCRRGDGYFGMYINYGLMPSKRWAQGWLTRFDNTNQSRWSCDSPLAGANGHVQSRQTWCRTPSIQSSDVDVEFLASGDYFEAVDNGYDLIGGGTSAICNRITCPS